MLSSCSLCKPIDSYELNWILACRCNEESNAGMHCQLLLIHLITAIEWTWEDTSTNTRELDVCENGKRIVFHPVSSHGTAAVRGSKALGVGLHYWELKAISPIYGTDMVPLFFKKNKL